jgi:hypothetical protein
LTTKVKTKLKWSGQRTEGTPALPRGRGREKEHKNDNNFASIGRRAATVVSRRRSLRLLGGAGLAGAITAPTVAGAGKGGKKGKKGKNRCRQLGEQCRRGVAEICQSQGDPAACEEQHAPCCAHFVRCRVSAGVECVIFND